MQLIKRTNCVVCDAVLTGHHIVLARVPIYMGVTSSPVDEDVFQDQHWITCAMCGCVQLSELLDPSVLYATTHTPGTVGITWNKHHNDFADYVVSRFPKKILEIGAGTTLLASLIQQKTMIDSYTIVDPNVIDRGDNVRIIRKLITPEFSLDETFDTVVHSHTMEHFYNPVEELKALSRLLVDRGQMIISVPLIVNSIIDGYSNGLNFEHTYMTTIPNLYTLLARAGLRLTSVSTFNKYNVFITAMKDSGCDVVILDDAYGNHKLWALYHEKLWSDAKHIENKLVGCDPHSTYLFGAHIFSQVLLSMTSLDIYAILDNDRTKQDKRLYGTPYRVLPPDIIMADRNPVVVVRAAQYTNEISDQLRAIKSPVTII